MEPSDWIGFVGVGILLLAFLLNLLKKVEQNSFTYIGLNTLGAALACLASILIRYVPFIILEGAWTIVSLVTLFILISKKRLAS